VVRFDPQRAETFEELGAGRLVVPVHDQDPLRRTGGQRGQVDRTQGGEGLRGEDGACLHDATRSLREIPRLRDRQAEQLELAHVSTPPDDWSPGNDGVGSHVGPLHQCQRASDPQAHDDQ
jgi:hypothetical protein